MPELLSDHNRLLRRGIGDVEVFAAIHLNGIFESYKARLIIAGWIFRTVLCKCSWIVIFAYFPLAVRMIMALGNVYTICDFLGLSGKREP